MKCLRALLIAAPLALALTACGGGGSTTLANATGQASSIRYVNGSPDIGTVDLYYIPTGQTLGATPQVPTAAYGTISDFQSEPSTAGQVFAYPAGNKSTPTLSCSIPQMSNNGLYTVVISGQVAQHTLQCSLFQDTPTSATGQVRVHHASPAAAAVGLSTIAFGFYNAPYNAVNQPTLGVAGAAPFPGFATAGGVQQNSFVTVGVSTVTSTSTAIGIGAGTYPVNASGVFTPALTIDAAKLVNPGTTTAGDTAGTIPGPSYNNASIFAIDCGTNATTPQGTTCASGAGLIGSFDSK